MRNFFTFRQIGLWLVLCSITSISPIIAQAPQFGQPYYISSLSFSEFTGAWGSDVIFDNNCNGNVYMVGNSDNGGMTWTYYEGEVIKLDRQTNSTFSYYAPVTSPQVGMIYENSISDISASESGYISYSGYIDGDYGSAPYINTFIFDISSNAIPEIKDILSSPTNNYTYTCGTFTDTINFGNNIGLYAGGTNGFLAKFWGGTAVWAIILPNTTPKQLINLSDETFAIVGNFVGTVSIDGNTISTNTGGDMFFGKFLSTGICTKLTQITAGTCLPRAAKITTNGDIYITGTHSNGAIVANTTLNDNGAFVAKLDSSGLALSAKHIGSTTAPLYNDMDIDQNGNTYLVVDNTTLYKYSIANTLLWDVSVSTFNPQTGTDVPRISGVGVDKNGNVGIAGFYSHYAGLAIGNTGWVSGDTWISSDPIGFYSLALGSTIIQNGTSLSANTTGASYQWLNCNDNSPISGANTQTFSPTVNGNYAVVITQNDCIDTSDCYAVTNVSIESNNLIHQIKAYPNPNQGTLKIDLGDEYSSVTVSITSLIGQEFLTKTDSHLRELQIEMPKIEGIYFVKITLPNGESAVFRIIKE